MADAPKILGVEMTPLGRCWMASFGLVWVSITVWDRNLCASAFINDRPVRDASAVPIPDCIAAIERELLKIREAIPEPDPCAATEIGSFLERLPDVWSRYQRGDLDREEFEGFVAECAESKRLAEFLGAKRAAIPEQKEEQ